MSKRLITFLWLVSVAGAFLGGIFVSELTVLPSPSLGPEGPSQSVVAGRSAPNSSEKPSADPAIKVTNLSARSLVAAVRVHLNGNPSPFLSPSSLRVLAQLADLSVEETRTALEEVEDTIKAPQLKIMLYSVLLGKIAENDGPGALAYIDENLNRLSSIGKSAKASAIATWANSDPDAVWDYYQKQKSEDDELARGMSPEGGMILPAIFVAMVAKDMSGAMERLQELDGTERSMAINGLVQGAVWDEEKRAVMLAASADLGSAGRQQLRSQVVSRWANADAEAAVEWVVTLPEEERGSLLSSVANNIMTTNPQRGAAVLIENASAEERPSAYTKVIQQWAQIDPNSAGEWLGSQPQGPELDLARAHFSSVVATQDPESAMAWAMAVEDPDVRAETINLLEARSESEAANIRGGVQR